jgi:hypothetical protein
LSSTRSKFAALAAAAGLLLGAAAETASGRSIHASGQSQAAAAADVTPAEANAMQAAAVAAGEANSALANPYVEQKVTTPESTGKNTTRIPAGGF